MIVTKTMIPHEYKAKFKKKIKFDKVCIKICQQMTNQFSSTRLLYDILSYFISLTFWILIHFLIIPIKHKDIWLRTKLGVMEGVLERTSFLALIYPSLSLSPLLRVIAHLPNPLSERIVRAPRGGGGE
jgi:hypothetical protein